MTIVIPVMRIVLPMKIIVRCPKSSYHSLHYHTKDDKVKKFLNPSRQLYIDLYQITQSSNFQIKDKTKFHHKHDLVYYVKCPECQEDYIGEIGRRLHEWICDHSGKNNKSHMLKHYLEINHKQVSFEDFHILRNGHTNNKIKRKILEAFGCCFCTIKHHHWSFTSDFILGI